MYRTRSCVWTNEIQHGIQKIPACGRDKVTMETKKVTMDFAFFAIAFNIKKCVLN